MSFEQAIQEGTLVFDGAMGTELYRRNVLTNRCFDELCLSQPRMVEEIHQAYATAGAEVLTTNTYGANRPALERFGFAEQLEDINRAAVALARGVAEKAGHTIYVAGSIGPSLRESSSQGESAGILEEQIRVLADATVDLIIFETLPTREAAERAAAAMKCMAGLPYILSFAVYQDNESRVGEPVTALLAPLPSGAVEPVAWGFNCASGPDALLTAAECAMPLIRLPLIVQPNAGVPREVGGRQIYLCSPDYIGVYAKRYLKLGVRGIGGCCGTTPDHIREIAQRVKPLSKKRHDVTKVELAPDVQLQPATPFGEKSRFAARLAQGHWVTSVELLPPRGYDLTDTVERARRLHEHGVDAINIPDGPRASSRISPLMTSVMVQREAKIEVILHFCCRDRNLIGMQADLLACAACGLRNILFVTGDPPKLGNYPFATGVFDMDSIGLCRVQQRLNQGVDLGGQRIDPQTHAAIGVGADPTALDQERELRRFAEKLEAGAEFAITQPMFDADALLRFLDKLPASPVKILAGIWPLASFRNALFLRNEVPGVSVPDSIMERLESVNGKEDQRKMGIEIAREIAAQVHDRVQGIQVSPPFGNVDTALAVVE